MAIKARSVEMFELSAELGLIGTFRIISQWEGFKKMECIDNGEVIIVAPKRIGPMENTFNSLFGEIFNIAELKDMIIIAASPELASRIKELSGSSK